MAVESEIERVSKGREGRRKSSRGVEPQEHWERNEPLHLPLLFCSFMTISLSKMGGKKVSFRWEESRKSDSLRKKDEKGRKERELDTPSFPPRQTRTENSVRDGKGKQALSDTLLLIT